GDGRFGISAQPAGSAARLGGTEAGVWFGRGAAGGECAREGGRRAGIFGRSRGERAAAAEASNSGEAAQAEAADSASEEDTWLAPIGSQTSLLGGWGQGEGAACGGCGGLHQCGRGHNGGGKGSGLPVVAVVGNTITVSVSCCAVGYVLRV
ncbi:unnamed protein product, partial [Closterium sp. Naga37s-1]